MTPDQAVFLAHLSVRGIENEFQTTKKVIAAIPADNAGYKPDPKAKSAFELAWHIASSDIWFLDSVAAGEFAPEPNEKPDNLRTPQDIVGWYDQNFAAAIAKVRALSAEQLSKPLNFYNVFNYPAVFYLGFTSNHVIHHRGQLSSYLRPMGSKCPSIYGGSADEPFVPPATAQA